MKVYITLVLLAVVSAASAQGDLASVISQIFGNSSDPAVADTAGRAPAANTAPTSGPSTIVPPFVNTTPGTTEPEPCVTDKGEQGECVRYFLCNNNNTIIDDGTGLIDIRNDIQTPLVGSIVSNENVNVRDGPCASYLDVCCLTTSKRPTTDPIIPKPDPSIEKRVGCGYLQPKGVAMRITGDIDSEAKFGEFPWMVAILKVEPVNEKQPDGQKLNVYVGGGSLIHPSVVLTAAHNVVAPQELRVRAGEWDTQTKNEIYPYQERGVTNVVTHKDFNKGNLFYDIALLFLSAPVQPAPHIGVACLPRPNERARGATRCLASGWGKDNFGKEGRYQVILKRVEVPVVERNPCQEALRKTRLGRNFMLHSSFMCAGGEPGKDVCKGDGGSPLVCPIEFGDENRYVQNGIVAWGIGCGQDGTPGVYVDVANLRGWIDNEIAGKGFDVNTYSDY